MYNILFYMSSRSVTWLHMQIPHMLSWNSWHLNLGKKHYLIMACVSL